MIKWYLAPAAHGWGRHTSSLIPESSEAESSEAQREEPCASPVNLLKTDAEGTYI